MATIPNRNDILKKLERSEGQAVGIANDRIASLLNEATNLPVTLSVIELGGPKVQSFIVERLKQQGWSVSFSGDTVSIK